MSSGLSHVGLLAIVTLGICFALGCSSHVHGVTEAKVRPRRHAREHKTISNPQLAETQDSPEPADAGITSETTDAASPSTGEHDRDEAESCPAGTERVGCRGVPDNPPEKDRSDSLVDGGTRATDGSGTQATDGSDTQATDGSDTQATDGGGTQAADGGGTPNELPPDPGVVISEPDDAARYVFDQGVIRSYNILIAESDLAMIDMAPAAETYVNAMLEFEGRTYGPVGVRYKGSVGGFLAPCTAAAGVGARPGPKTGKCSMKIDFDRVDPDLRFYGLKKLNFHSMDRDPSMLRDRLGYSMFREFGVAAPRAMHARLSINGKLEGLYVIVEQIDGRFTHSRFSEGGDGNLYKEVWPVSDVPDPYLNALETNEDSNPSVDKMLRFEQAIDYGVETAMQWLDTDYTFKYIAADRVMINDDGAFHWYCSSNHNYYWYEAERADRIWIIPWDMDSSFQNGTFVHIAVPWNDATAECSCTSGQRPAGCDRLTSEWATLHDDYEHAVDAFLEGPFAASNVDAKLATWSAQVDSFVSEASGVNGAPVYADWQTAYSALRAIIESARMHRGYAYDAQPMPMSIPMSIPIPMSAP